jgi:hypothetical protein
MNLRMLCSRHCVPSFSRALPSWTPSARPSLYTLRRAASGEKSRRSKGEPVARGWGGGQSRGPTVFRSRVARGAREARATAWRACGEPAGEARERTRENICRGQPRRHGRWGGTHRKPGEVVICLVQKNADSDTAPPMAAQMGYTCARRDGRGTVSAGERGRGARLA